jgi:gluconokinase
MKTAIIVMGVSGSGKSSVAHLIGGHLEWQVAEGQGFLPSDSLAKLGVGRMLGDGDHRACLDRLREWIDRSHGSVVIAYAALRRAHRDELRRARARVVFLHLDGSPALIAQRTRRHGNHYVPPAMLAADFDSMEPLQPDEDGVVVSVIPDVVSVAGLGLDLMGL